MLTAHQIKSPRTGENTEITAGATTLHDFTWVRYVKYAVLFGSAAASSHAEELDSAVPKTDLETYS
jgi:hypothetical protein